MSEDSVRIPVEDLRRVFHLVLRHVEANAGDQLEVEHDYFWSVASDELTNVYERPAELTIGQVSESR
jgi:hypothetical protein